MSQQVTLKNISNEPVLVGDKFLFPNGVRTVPKKIGDTALDAYPGALEVRSAADDLTVGEGTATQTDNEDKEEATPPADEKTASEEAQQVDEKADDSEAGAAGGATKKRGSRSKSNTE